MIDTYKQLYKLGKMMKAPLTCLYVFLKKGYETSRYGYRASIFTENDQNSEEFKKDCIVFSKAAEAFGKLLGKELVRPDLWKKRQRFVLPIQELNL